MAKLPVPIRQLGNRKLTSLLASASRTIGVPLCLHDRINFTQISKKWCTHNHPACLEVKRETDRTCVTFDQGEVHREISRTPDGRIHVCPFGFTEIAVPVQVRGILAGVLFAGPCWTGDEESPCKSLFVPPDQEWLEDRRVMLGLVARQIEQWLSEDEEDAPTNRRDVILEYINLNLYEPVSLDDLAKHLCLSPSRTSHLTRELFDKTFPELINEAKLQEAAYLLISTDYSVGEVASRLGYNDQNYFSRAFKKVFGTPPREFRQKAALTA